MAAMARAAVAAARRWPAEPAGPRLGARPAQQARARRLAAAAIATRPQLVQRPVQRPIPRPVQPAAPLAQPLVRTSAARYRQTAAAARRPAPPLAALRTSTRCSASAAPAEASARQEFLVREPSPDSAVDLNIMRWE